MQTTYTSKDQIIPSVEDVVNYFNQNGIEEKGYAIAWWKEMTDKNWRFVKTGEKILNWNRIARLRIQDVLAQAPKVTAPKTTKPKEVSPVDTIAEYLHKLYCQEKKVGQMNGYKESVLELITMFQKKHELETPQNLLSALIEKIGVPKTYDYSYLEEILLD